jgi:hypothetical protein
MHAYVCVCVCVCVRARAFSIEGVLYIEVRQGASDPTQPDSSKHLSRALIRIKINCSRSIMFSR